jgi:hypothetical protein
MSGTHARLLLAMVVAAVVAAMGISSAAEARHWRYHWRYHQGFYQGTDEDRGEDTALRTFGNYRSRIEADDFGQGIKGMIPACTTGRRAEEDTVRSCFPNRAGERRAAQCARAGAQCGE